MELKYIEKKQRYQRNWILTSLKDIRKMKSQ